MKYKVRLVFPGYVYAPLGEGDELEPLLEKAKKALAHCDTEVGVQVWREGEKDTIAIARWNLMTEFGKVRTEEKRLISLYLTI